MRLLVDTYVALWALTDDPKLAEHARALIEVADEPLVSVVTIWEIAIKHVLRQHRRDAIALSGKAAHALFQEAGYGLLSITGEHAAGIGDLPNHHADPFDRLLIAQAITDRLLLLTADAMLPAYGEMIVRA